MTAWEKAGISIEDYARSFNEQLDKAYERQVKGKMYFVSVTKPMTVHRICNIKVSDSD